MLEEQYQYNGADYYYRKNLFGDVLAIYDSDGTVVAEYLYDAWGKNLPLVGDETNEIKKVNPIRYRSYYYDTETGFYYLESRYYDPEIGRFLNADTLGYLGEGEELNKYNLFVYCGNNPVMYSDPTGHAIETILDVLSLGVSLVEVAVNPADPWAWVGLAGDFVDLVPFLTGVGETTRAIKIGVSLADGAGDVVQAARKSYRAMEKLDDAYDIVRATGSYEIVYKSGKKYVGKGGFYRATTSALEHLKTGDIVESIYWRSAPNKNWAFVDEYARQLINKFDLGNYKNGYDLYNEIWSPGRRIVNGIRGI